MACNPLLLRLLDLNRTMLEHANTYTSEIAQITIQQFHHFRTDASIKPTA